MASATITSEKTPLQAVVSVICDALCDLPVADQQRAIEAVCMTLGTVTPPAPPQVAGGGPTISMLAELLSSLRPEQLTSLRRDLDATQLMLINELANQVMQVQGTAAT